MVLVTNIETGKKEKNLEILNKYVKEVTLLHVSWIEGESIHILIRLDGIKEPRLYSFPWDSIQAQEFDESFLESLPEDVKKDVLERSVSQEDSSSKNYRSSQYSSKLSFEEDLLELKSRLEADLNELENRLERDDDQDGFVESLEYDSSTWQGSLSVVNGGDCDDTNATTSWSPAGLGYCISSRHL